MPSKALGLLGGTFDPIHEGHLRLGLAALEHGRLDKVLFIPNNIPPHKNYASASSAQRVDMVELAIAPYPQFQLCLEELHRTGPSYAVDTVRKLKELYPGEQLYFITGADAILEIDTWYQAEELLGLCRFLAAARPGFSLSKLNQLAPKWQQVIDLIPIEETPISSTLIRKNLAENQSIAHMVPQQVEEYIYRHNLYGKDRENNGT